MAHRRKSGCGDKMAVENELTMHGDPPEEEEEEEQELVDPVDALKEKCEAKPECVKYKARLDECTDRVNSRPDTEETCEEELFDFIHCVDHCVSKCLFKNLK